MTKVLFLGYEKSETCLIGALENFGCEVLTVGQSSIILDTTIDWVISFGYKKIITQHEIDFYQGKLLNLHISYLPWNRGSHPNYWSHVENTPCGVTIHQIDNGIDTGDIYVQKQVKIDKSVHTFNSSWKFLLRELELLFLDNFKNIFSEKLIPQKQKGIGSLHYVKELPDDVDWSMVIQEYLNEK